MLSPPPPDGAPVTTPTHCYDDRHREYYQPLYVPLSMQNPAAPDVTVEALGFHDSGSDYTIITFDIAVRLSLDVIPLHSLSLSFSPDSPPQPRSETRTQVLFRCGARDWLALVDVSPLQEQEHVLLGRDFQAAMGILVGPLPLRFPSELIQATDDDFIDYSERDPRVEDEVLPQELERQRTSLRAHVQHWLTEHTRTVTTRDYINHPDAVVTLNHKPHPDFVAYVPPRDKRAGPFDDHINAQVLAWLDEGRTSVFDPVTHGKASGEAFPLFNIPLMASPQLGADGLLKKVRVCGDLRRFNCGLVLDNSPLTDIRDIYERVGEFSFFTELDLRSAFLQFPVHPDHKHKLCFMWRGVRYVFNGAIFGLAHMAQICNRVLNSIFSDLANVFVYCDNILIGSKNLADHEQHVQAAIQLCTRFSIRLSPDKCQIACTRLKTLGNILMPGGILPDPAKVRTVMRWPVPTNADELLVFTAFCNYLRQFVRHYSEIAAPLEKARQTKPFTWTQACQTSFDLLKHAIAHAPMLKTPNRSQPFAIAVDSSIAGIGGVLYQPANPGDLPQADTVVTFSSRSLKDYERGYSVYKLEANALVWCFRQFDVYLYGNHFSVLTDHNSLTYLHTMKDINRVLLGWWSVILEYDFGIKHVPGKLNVLADALSRSYPSKWGIPAPLGDAQSSPLALQSLIRPPAVVSQVQTPAATDAAQEPNPSGGQQASLPATQAPATSQGLVPSRSPDSPEEAEQLVQDTHAQGHFGIRSTMAALRREHWLWPGMSALVRRVVASCKPCQAWSMTRQVYHPARSIKSELPWDHIEVDLITSFETTSSGYNYIMVIIDIFTSFCLLRSLKSRDATEVAEILWAIFADFGVPKILQTDGEGAFVSDVVRTMVEEHGIEHKHIPAYHPAINGKVERQVAIVSDVLRKRMHETGIRDWTRLLPLCQLEINIKHRNLTNSNPFALFLNRTLNNWQSYTNIEPADLHIGDLEIWKQREAHLHDQIFPALRFRSDALQSADHEDIDKSHLTIGTRLPIGALVMVLDVLRGTKNSPPWLGPYTVVRASPGGTYTLRDAAGGLFHRDVPRNQLKLLTGAEKPTDETYYADKILDHRKKPSGLEYLIQWAGYSEPSWEPVANIDDHDLVREYTATLQRLPTTTTTERTPSQPKRAPKPKAKGPPLPPPATPLALPPLMPPAPPLALPPLPPPRGDRPSMEPSAHYVWDNPSKNATMRPRIRITAIDEENATATFVFPDHPSTMPHTKPWTEIIPEDEVPSRHSSRTRPRP